MSIILENLNEQYRDQLGKKYRYRFDSIQRAYPNFTDDKKYRLGVLLENTERYLASKGLLEATQVSDVVRGIKNDYFDIISAAFPGLIAEDLFSVQPLQNKSGTIFWLKFVYGNTKGRYPQGGVAFGPYGQIEGYPDESDLRNSSISDFTNPGYYKSEYGHRGYTGEYVDEESLTIRGDGSTTTFSGNLSYGPVLAGSVKITDGTNVYSDDGQGHLELTTGTAAISQSTINYDTGAYVLKFTTAPANDTAYTADYYFDLSYAPSGAPEIEVRIVDSIIQARPRKLRGTYSLDAAYDLQQSQGVDMKEQLLRAASMLLRHETDADLIRTAYVQAAGTSTFNANYNNVSAAISISEFYESFVSTLVEASSTIRKATKKYEGNWVVVGKKGADMLQVVGAPRFVPTEGTVGEGPCLIGTLNGRMKVYINPFFRDEEYLVGYKGDGLVEAGLVYAPYMPFYATDTVMLDDFLGRKGFATSYGKKMVCPDMFVRGTIL